MSAQSSLLTSFLCTTFLFLFFSLVLAENRSETPRTYTLRITNEIRTGDIVALVFAFAGTLIFAVYLWGSILQRMQKTARSASLDSNAADQLDEDSIIKHDVSGKSHLSTASSSSCCCRDDSFDWEDVIGALSSALVTFGFICYMANFDED